MLESEIIEIKVKSNYGDIFERTLSEPTCTEILDEFIDIVHKLGYARLNIYTYLLECAETLKKDIMSDYNSIIKL